MTAEGSSSTPSLRARLSALDVENVYVYVADALRWDFLPDEVANRGTAVKTVAAGIHSPTSMASLVSGTYLPQHHVARFSDSVPGDVPNLLASDDAETALINSINHVRIGGDDEDDIITSTLGADGRHPDALAEVLSAADSPSFVFERGAGGHAPYGDFEGNGWEYFEERGDVPRHQFAAEYRRAVEKDAEWFRSRLETLAERGREEDTLVVFTSDHGELLGEHGTLAHGPPIHPAHVYVPTVFLHPDLERGVVTDRVCRHVDLVPTVAALLDLDLSAAVPPVGRDLTTEPLADHGVTFHTAEKRTSLVDVSLPYESAWSPNGGYVFPGAGRTERLLFAGRQLFRMPWRAYARRNLGAFLLHQLRGDRIHGAPTLSPEEAREAIDDVRNREVAMEREEVSEVAEESLRQLGYID